MEGRYSTRSPAVKRLMREAQELCEPTDQYFAQPLEDNLFEWHFTIRGPADSDFQAGLYHGRIILPVDYPMKPPSIIWLTPNGRFETNKKICLSISGHHPESWQPSWSIRTALLAIIGFMPTHPGGAIGSLDYKPEERKALAKKSRDWKCPVCGDVSEILLEPNPEASQTSSQEAKELASQISFQGEKPKPAETQSTVEGTVTSPPCTEATSTTTTTTSSTTESLSNNTSPTSAEAAPTSPEQPPTSAGTATAPGTFYPPWLLPPVVPTPNSAMPPAFIPFPWTCMTMPQAAPVGGIVSQIPRFPYPPSHYTTSDRSFFPPGFPFPPGVGMFPGPFPVPPVIPTFGQNQSGHDKTQPASLNNSSLSPPNRSPERGSHSQSPDAVQIPNIPPPSPASAVSSLAGTSVPVSPQCSPLKEHVLNELLSKVKRVGSDTQMQSESAADVTASAKSPTDISATVYSQASIDHDSTLANKAHETQCKEVEEQAFALVTLGLSSGSEHDVQIKNTLQVHEGHSLSTGLEPLVSSHAADVSTITAALKSAFDIVEEAEEKFEHEGDNAVENPQDAEKVQAVGDQCLAEDKSHATDTDVSVSLLRKESLNESTGMEISHSELSVDPGEGGELGNLQVEMSDTEQRSHFERSTSSSMPDLQKKLKQGSLKGLRQRQSALVQIPSDGTAEEQTLSDQASSGSGRPRIEAVAGDSSLPNHQRFLQNVAGNDAAHNRVHEAQQAGRRAAERPTTSFDVSLVVMICLCVTTVFILLNRLFYMIDFSVIFHD